MLGALVFLAVIFCCQAQEYHVKLETPGALPPSTSRIIGGHPTTIERYPYTVQILAGNALALLCGGSLVTARHVVSAAHCFIDPNGTPYSPRLFTIRAGATNLGSGGTTVGVSTIVNHEGYNRFTFDNDVAVLVLVSRLTLGSRISTIAIAAQGTIIQDNSVVTLVGWGSTEYVPISQVLNEVQVYVVNQGVCATRYREIINGLNQPATITAGMLCTGVLDVGGRDACQGDSGGPVIFNNILVGITSWGAGCAVPRYPGVNARVSSYANWIDNTVRRYNAGSRLESVSPLVMASLIVYMILSDKY